MRSALVILLALTLLTPSRNADGADAALIEAAKKEGKVVWYTTLIVNQDRAAIRAPPTKRRPPQRSWRKGWPAACRPTSSTASPT